MLLHSKSIAFTIQGTFLYKLTFCVIKKSIKKSHCQKNYCFRDSVIFIVIQYVWVYLSVSAACFSFSLEAGIFSMVALFAGLAV